MKVINEKDYIFVSTKGGWHKFVTNPNKVNFDKEIVLVQRARYVKEDGTLQFFDYVRETAKAL